MISHEWLRLGIFSRNTMEVRSGPFCASYQREHDVRVLLLEMLILIAGEGDIYYILHS